MRLAGSKFFDRRRIQADQLEKLQMLVTTLLGSNTFYSGKLGAAKRNCRFTSLDEFSERVPFTVKQELVDDQRNKPALWLEPDVSLGALHSLPPDERNHGHSHALAGHAGELELDA